MSFQQNIAILMALLVLWLGLAPVASAQQAKLPNDRALKAKLIEIPTGSVIVVKMNNKEKLRGKLGTITDAGFDVQTVREGKIESLTLTYGSVKSVDRQGKGMSTAGKVTLGALAGAGVFFLVMFIAYAAVGI